MNASMQEIVDISTAARIMALQEAARVCVGRVESHFEGDDPGAREARGIAVELLTMARDAEPAGRDLDLEWDLVLAAKVDEWADS